jgi:serine/threonine protein kinase
MPKVWSGNFAQVYELRNGTRRWAVKCFTRGRSDLRERYHSISRAIGKARLPYFVDFQFLDGEMLVAGVRHPVVKMEWIDGQPLDGYVEANLSRPSALRATATGLRTLVADLERRGIAHGDLQHGNILVTPGGLRLIDYDGLFVPAFSGGCAPEAGLPSYQHPRRAATDYQVGLDRFSLLVITTALLALAAEPALWQEFSTGDNLLFTSRDFRDPLTSPLCQRLRVCTDGQVRELVQGVAAACTQPPLSVPMLDAACRPTAAASVRPWWMSTAAVRPERRWPPPAVDHLRGRLRQAIDRVSRYRVRIRVEKRW